MVMDWKGYRKDLLATIGQMANVSHDVVRGYRVLSGAGKKQENWTPRRGS